VAWSLFEDVSLWRGFLFTLDTVATVGSNPDPSDLGGQITKVLLILVGVGTLFYALVTVTEFFVAGHLGEILLERRTLNKIEDLSGHHLICGFGRVGRQVARDLAVTNEKFVVIDELAENKEHADQLALSSATAARRTTRCCVTPESSGRSPSSPASTRMRRTSSSA